MKLLEINRDEARLILTEGITHIDDQKIPIEKFIDILKRLEEFEITEKVDGANLWMGLDVEGNFYTSRGKKEGGEFYNQNDWGNAFKDTGFKSAHAALERKVPEMKKAGLSAGDVVEVEVLFGDKPNTIPYWPNQIIFLRRIQGDPDIEGIANALEGKRSEVQVNNVPFTNDGEIIEREDQNHSWSFSKVQKYEPDIAELKSALDAKIKNIENFLVQPNIADLKVTNKTGEERVPTNIEVLGMRATKPEIKEAKEIIKDVIDGSRDSETGKRSGKSGLRWEIKEILIDKLVRTAQSTLGPTIEQGGWIEGVVLKRPSEKGDELFKVVDKDIFTAVNKFNYQVRSFLTDKHKGTESPREAAGILGNMLRDMAKVINHPQLGTIQAKRYLEKLGRTPNEKISAIVGDVDLESTKISWIRLLERTEKLLQTLLEQYKDQVADKEYVDPVGRAHKYDDEIDKRTLQVFAELKNDLTTYIQSVSGAKKPEELVMVLIGDKV